MLTKSISFLALVSAALGLPASAAVSIDWVAVGDIDNQPDPLTGYGAVDHAYQISKNETTIAQYTEFLNAVAATDSRGLYNTNMASTTLVAGISRSGSSGSYTYSAIGGGNRPVTYVSWFDAARFCNWMHNGQGNGSTETGAYMLNGATSGIYTVAPNATYWIPSEEEWYKAAYYDQTKDGGAGGYWLHPTQSDTAGGNTIGDAGAANYWDGDHAEGQNNLPSFLSDVGAYGTGSDSYYGTNDQGGNVWEWNDAVIGSSRGIRGGSWNDDETEIRASFRGSWPSTQQGFSVGFRVASVPEPTVVLLTMLGGVALFLRRHL